MQDFDQTKYFLGILCRRKHEWKNTGQSLRYINGSICIECKKEVIRKYTENKKEKILDSIKDKIDLDFDNSLYYLGDLCHNKHRWNNTDYSLRYINSGQICVECRKIRSSNYRTKNREQINQNKKKYYRDNFEQIKEKTKASYLKNKDKISEYSIAYREKNKDKIKLQKQKSYLERKDVINRKARIQYKNDKEKYQQRIRKYHLLNKDKISKYLKEWHREKSKTDPKYKLNNNMRSAIRNSLKKRENNFNWETLVGYSVDKLKKHLEKQFKEGMTWENYGKWHIDHKIPIAAFNFNKPTDIDFQRCWNLKNLQPLWSIDNIKKGAKLKESFQPSLALG